MRTKSHAAAASALKGITDTAVRGFVGFFFDDRSKTSPHQGGIRHKREVDIAIPAEGVILRVDLKGEKSERIWKRHCGDCRIR